ncbi:MAG: SDR family NAD(P)-dependent oxidoreductase [Bellilinea sp.]
MDDILITGGTGSFGHAFVRRLLSEGTNGGRVIIFSRDELKQWNMRQTFQDHPGLRFFVGDVRDQQRLRRALDGVHTVIHAAALKRIEVGHYNPLEMVKTNVMGSVNLIEAAMDAKVSKVVALSTDKAFHPVSPYGASKAMAEALFLAANNTSGANGPKFSVTRYGNVSGSNGSVIPIWRKMIAEGAKWVPVTDPDCTRFWMTMDEAVDLVQETIENMAGGELVIPELPAFRIGDLAAAMNVPIHITGLNNWEKKHESMKEGNSSFDARRMSVEELREGLKNV